MKIKVCGLREVENIQQVYMTGVRIMGFIFYDQSKRFIDPSVRESLFSQIPSDVLRVGVFVNEDLGTVVSCVEKYGLKLVQLHGEESPEYCKELQKHVEVMKAFRVDEDFDFSQLRNYSGCDYLLFDAKGKEYGGNGIKYDWNILENYTLDTPFLLSGGIEPADVDKILSFTHPSFVGIDVNSGFEIAPGRKDTEKIKSFVRQLECSTQ